MAYMCTALVLFSETCCTAAKKLKTCKNDVCLYTAKFKFS